MRLRGAVPLRGGFNAGVIYRNTPGATHDATQAVTQVRFVSAARTTLNTAQTLNLYTPNSVFGERFSQFDVSLSKMFNLGGARLRVAFDVYNVLNSNSIQTVRTAYSTSTVTPWLQPTAFLDPRLARITGRIDF